MYKKKKKREKYFGVSFFLSSIIVRNGAKQQYFEQVREFAFLIFKLFDSFELFSKNIVAVFVVQFDVHKGNIIEWQYPEGT